MDKNKMARVLKGDMGMNEEELIAFLQQNLQLCVHVADNYNYGQIGGKMVTIGVMIKGQYITQTVFDLPGIGYK